MEMDSPKHMMLNAMLLRDQSVSLWISQWICDNPP